MASIRFVHKGNFKKTEDFLGRAKRFEIVRVLNYYGRKGVEALSEATPVRTGKAASSWSYEIKETDDGYSIYWTNSDTNKGIPIVVLIQYGHGTGTGGYVPSFDFINPVMNPLFDEITHDVMLQLVSGSSGGGA